MKSGIQLITQERSEQVVKHKFQLTHDETHSSGELAKVAGMLAVEHTDALVIDPSDFIESSPRRDPWGLSEKYKDNTSKRLIVAGALIAAELDRINECDYVEDIRRASTTDFEELSTLFGAECTTTVKGVIKVNPKLTPMQIVDWFRDKIQPF